MSSIAAIWKVRVAASAAHAVDGGAVARVPERRGAAIGELSQRDGVLIRLVEVRAIVLEGIGDPHQVGRRIGLVPAQHEPALAGDHDVGAAVPDGLCRAHLRHGADNAGGRRAVLAGRDDAEAMIAGGAVLEQLLIAGLENVERKQGAGKEHDIEGEQGQAHTAR